jgi:hypothetical protein
MRKEIENRMQANALNGRSTKSTHRVGSSGFPGAEAAMRRKRADRAQE